MCLDVPQSIGFIAKIQKRYVSQHAKVPKILAKYTAKVLLNVSDIDHLVTTLISAKIKNTINIMRIDIGNHFALAFTSQVFVNQF